jgi:hypothetical protein
MLAAAGSRADTLRVTTWNLGFEPNKESSAAVVEAAAGTLKDLAPDVILLQGVHDWHMCQDLAEALQPLDYSVLICSDFQRNTPLLPARPQLAILSRPKAYFVWSESWAASGQPQASGGAAFAAVDAGTQRLGFFTALMPDPSSAEDAAQRLVREMNSVGRWETNQVQSFVIAASSDPVPGKSSSALRNASSAFEQAGLVDATESIPSHAKTTLRSAAGMSGSVADYLFAGPLAFPSNPRITVCPASAHYPITCDIELDPDKVTTAMDIRAENRRLQDAQAALLLKRVEYGIGISVSLGLLVLLGRRSLARKQAGKAPLRSNPLPARIADGDSPSPLRPVIFAQAPPKQSQPQRVALPQAPRPVLRLQPSTRATPPPPAKENATELQPPIQNVEVSLAPKRRDPLEVHETHIGDPARGANPGAEASVRHGVIRELSAWLKHKLVRKLVTDRAQLMEAQQIATRMATNLDGRLSRIEAQIQKQNQAYVHRIEELNKELAEAREENRELIRERIAQVKAEMEAAQAKVLAEANLDSTSFRL